MAMPVCGVNRDLDQLWETHRDYVRRVLLELTRDADLADDLLQDTYIKAASGFANYRGGSIRSWLSTIARNTFYSFVRRHSYSRECALEDDSSVEGGANPGAEMNLDMVRVRKAMAALPAKLRDLLLMKHYGGFTYEEIAQSLGCPSGTVKWKMSMAMGKLRDLLGPAQTQSPDCGHLNVTDLLDYLYGIGTPDFKHRVREHLGICSSCRESAEQSRSLMVRLDELESSHKLIEILELDTLGDATLYYDANVVNSSDRILDRIAFRMNKLSTLLRVSAQGEDMGWDHGRDDYFEWDSGRFVRSRCVVPLPEPVAPGECVDLLTVSKVHPERRAQQLDDGRFRFRWTQFPSVRWVGDNPDCAIAFSQAIRLPVGARLLKAHPLPAEIRNQPRVTLIWNSMISQFGPFDCSVEYRVRADRPDATL